MRKFFIAVMVIVSLLTIPAGEGSLAAGESGSATMTLEDRRDALDRQAGLGEKEKELVAELLAWDVKIEAARQEQERLREEIPVVERSLVTAQAGLEESRASLDLCMERLGQWVNFLYRYGPVAYLEVVLGAADFNDFVERAEAVKIVIVTQVQLLDEVRDLTARQEEQVSALKQAQAELEEKSSQLAGKMKEMEDSRAGREEFLSGIRQQSVELAGEIVQTEMFWYRSINSLHYLLAHLDSLPWRNLSPDTFSLSGNRLRVEFNDREINRIFFEQGDASLAGLSVRSTPGLFAISGPAVAGGGEFKIDGNFIPLGEGKVRFQPEGMFLAGFPVSREVLRFVSSERGLTIDLGDSLQGYGVSEVRPEEGKLVVLLAAN